MKTYFVGKKHEVRMTSANSILFVEVLEKRRLLASFKIDTSKKIEADVCGRLEALAPKIAGKMILKIQENLGL